MSEHAQDKTEKQDVTALRGHLFATLAALRDEKNPMDIERAKAIASVAQVAVNSAKVEVEFMKATGAKGSGFIPDETPALPDGSNGSPQKPGILGTRTHLLK